MRVANLQDPVRQPAQSAGATSACWAGAPLPDAAFAAVQRRALLEQCKWDAQIGDVSTLARFPLILRAETWLALSKMAGELSVEIRAAESEIIFRPDLLKQIGLPRRVQEVLQQADKQGLTRSATRVLRFDFHLTTDGWRISEVNSDVPGGFTEASNFTQMMAAHCAGAAPAGDPLKAWSGAVARAAGENGAVCLLTAPGFMEDHQIMAQLARQLADLGCKTHLANPLQVEWRDGFAFLDSAWHRGPLDAIVRFYQGEWISNLPGSCAWSHYFCGGRTPVGNPGCAIISESKRLPLVWGRLKTRLPNWQGLLPETRDPRDVPWQTDDSWLVKSALCNTGDTVSIRSALNEQQWKSVVRAVKRRPEDWVAQRKFQPLALMTPVGMLYPCIGVYTIDGVVAGVYARVAARPVIDFEATDIACLVEGFDSVEENLIEHE